MSKEEPTREEAIEEGRRHDIPPEDAGAMYDKMQELMAKLGRAEIDERELRSQAHHFARQLVQKRILRTVMSPDLDVITGKLR